MKNRRKNTLIMIISLILFLSLFQPAAYAAGASSNNKEIVKTYEAILSDPNERIDYPETIEENGRKYKAVPEKNVLEVGEKQLVTENKTLTSENVYEDLKTKSTDGLEIPETKSLSYLGTLYSLKLADVTYEQKTVTDRTVHLTEVIAYPKGIRQPSPADIYEVEYADEESEQTITLQIPFSELVTVRGWHWEKCTFNCTFNGYGNAYYKLYDKFIPHNAEKPQIQGFESEVLKYLDLSPDSYRVLDASWDGGPSPNGTRNAIISAERRVAQYNAVYDGDMELPDITRYTATAHYELEGVYPADGVTYEYPATLKVTYETGMSAAAVVLIAAGIVCLALGIVILLCILAARKNKQRKAVRNGMEKYIRRR